jgi:hypothetical protein
MGKSHIWRVQLARTVGAFALPAASVVSLFARFSILPALLVGVWSVFWSVFGRCFLVFWSVFFQAKIC